MKAVHPGNNPNSEQLQGEDEANDQQMLALLESVRARPHCRPADVDRLLRQHSRNSKTRLTRVQLSLIHI